MIGVLGHDSALQGYTRPGTTCANEMNFVMIHTPNAGSIVEPVDQQSSTLYSSESYPQFIADMFSSETIRIHTFCWDL